MKTTLSRWSPLPLRILLGIGCVHHGWHNVIMADERQAFTWMLREIGNTSPTTLLWIISATSFVGGLALITGAFVRLVALPLAVNVAAIMFVMHVPSGFDYLKLTAVTSQGPQYGMPGYEVSLLYMAGLIALGLSGAGPMSIDRARARKRRRDRADHAVAVRAAPVDEWPAQTVELGPPSLREPTARHTL